MLKKGLNKEKHYNNSMKEIKTPNSVRNKAFEVIGFNKPENKRHWSFTGPKRGYKKAPVGALQPSPERWAMLDRG